MKRLDSQTSLLLTVLILLAGSLSAQSASRLPGPDLNLRLTAPIQTWDEAVPLGNGAMGVLLWGETNTLRLSLDRGDLWDERPSKKHIAVRDRFNWAAMQRMVAENRMNEFNEVFDSNYDGNGPPTKLPAGRVEITLGAGQGIQGFELNLATAEGRVQLPDGKILRAFVSAASVAEPVALVRIPGEPVLEVRLKPPDAVKQLGYPPARSGESEGLRWFEQQAADDFAYAVCVGWKRAGDETLLAVTVATRNEDKSPAAVAQRRVQDALRQRCDRLFAAHTAWWARFWETSRVEVPEAHILQHYYLVRYFYGAASRRGAPPVPLQGVWTADSGGLPPWKGDYHNDLNTQMTYMGYQAAGHFDEGASFLDLLWQLLPTFRKFAKEFYDAPGAAVPGVMSLQGQALGGWGQYSLSPTMGAWNAHLFYLHWRYTGDQHFLRTRAYPWCREVGDCLIHLLKPDANGVLKLPLSSSPEIFNNSRRAFLIPNSNYDLMSLRMLFLSLAEMAAACGDTTASARWSATARQLGDFHAVPDGTLLLDERTPLTESHRHLSNLIGLYPFNLITTEDGPRQRQMIESSLKQWDALGTRQWCGYSFTWMSALRARVGDAEAALRNLDIYTRAFVLRNGFHANGDQTKSGFSDMTYRPFTLEGNFLALAAVHDMLLQSWSTRPGSGGAGIIRVFPATPWRWHDAAFDDLHAEGGHRVSARRGNNATTWLRIVAGSDGVVKIRDNFGGREPKWNRSGVKKVGEDFEIKLRRGQILEAALPKPADIPPAPANAAQPVAVHGGGGNCSEALALSRAQTRLTSAAFNHRTSLRRWRAKVRLPRIVSRLIRQQRVKRRRQRFHAHDAGEHRPVADRILDEIRRALRHLQRVEFRGRLFDVRGDGVRFRTGKELRLVQLASLRRDGHCDFPSPDFLSFPLRGIGKRQPNAVIRHTQIPRRFRHEIRHDVLLDARFKPVRIQRIGRTHDRAAAPVEPNLLALGNRVSFRRHLRELPAECDAVSVAPLEFRPRRFRPVTPGGNHFQIARDFDFHGLCCFGCGAHDGISRRRIQATLRCRAGNWCARPRTKMPRSPARERGGCGSIGEIICPSRRPANPSKRWNEISGWPRPIGSKKNCCWHGNKLVLPTTSWPKIQRH